MIGKPEWFTYRIFGWGLRPKTKEGWIYIFLCIAVAGIISILPFDPTIKMYILITFIGILLIDVMHIMLQIDKLHDEREKLHQLIIERNSSFAAVAAIIVIIFYQSVTNRGVFDISLLIVLGAMVLAKSVSFFYAKLRM